MSVSQHMLYGLSNEQKIALEKFINRQNILFVGIYSHWGYRTTSRHTLATDRGKLGILCAPAALMLSWL